LGGGAYLAVPGLGAYLYDSEDRKDRYEEKKMREAKFSIGQVVKHRMFPFRGVVFDVDAEFSNTDEWWNAIPEPIRPRKDQPFYHLFAENSDNHYVAYVSEQNLVPDDTGEPIEHPEIGLLFEPRDDGGYKLRTSSVN
jgi:heat shock protein HspQ